MDRLPYWSLSPVFFLKKIGTAGDSYRLKYFGVIPFIIIWG